jgi:hypothetical protein
MPKGRKAGPCAFKAWGTTRDAHSAKADTASAIASSDRDASAAGEPAAVETATAEVTATTKFSSPTTTVASRPCHGT